MGGSRDGLWPEEESSDHINAQERMGKINGTQAGDPAKGGRAMWEIAKMEDPPLRIVIGSDAYKAVMNKIKEYGELYPKFEKLSNSTDVDGYKAS